jgi:hypothetical protein
LCLLEAAFDGDLGRMPSLSVIVAATTLFVMSMTASMNG